MLSRSTSSSAAAACPRSPALGQVLGVQGGNGAGGGADSRGLAWLELAGLLGALGPYPPCIQRWDSCLPSREPPVTTRAPESGDCFLGPTNPHRVRNWLQGWGKVSGPPGAGSAPEFVGRSISAPHFAGVFRPLPLPHLLDPFVSGFSPSSSCIPWTSKGLFPTTSC